MGLFGRKARPASLPADIVAKMAKYGKNRRYPPHDVYEILALDPYESGSFIDTLRAMPPDEQRGWISALSDAVVPVGGWAAYGAADFVMPVASSLGDLAAYKSIVEASLQFQRSSGVWESDLSGNERIFWEVNHPGEQWMTPTSPPSRDAAVIADLPVGQERKVVVMSAILDSNEVYASHPEAGRYVAIVEAPVERGEDRGRVRNEADSAESLYDLYCKLGQHMRISNHWVHPELEPFFPYPTPQI
jgi:hypothetical protein